MTERDQTIERLVADWLRGAYGYWSSYDATRKFANAVWDAGRAAQAPPTQRDIENLRKYAEAMAGMHDDDCPCDDTCACSGKEINDSVNRLCNGEAAPVQRETPQLKRELICDEHGEYKWVASTAPEQEGK